MYLKKNIKTIIQTLFLSILLSNSTLAISKSINETIGDTWKAQCKKEGGSRYACCQRKENECTEVSSGDKRAAECGQRYDSCISKLSTGTGFGMSKPQARQMQKQKNIDVPSNTNKPTKSSLRPLPATQQKNK
jgi:hypothetical protein